MKTMKRMAALLCLLALVLPVSAAEAPDELEPVTIGIRTVSELPESWNPLEELTADQKAILELTNEPLYRLYAGAVIPAQAAELPVDVTAEFAGRYGAPANASGGYAYAITLREGLFWEDGGELTLSDWAYTVEKQLERDRFPLEIANYRAYLRGDTEPAEEIISLMDAGYGSVAEAEEAGIFDFYIDTTNFWGLDTGWCRSTDRNKLFDEAIPSGCEEMYVTPAYLYREYLGKTGTQTMFQTEFVGIPVSSGEKLTMDDVGVFVDAQRLVLVMQEPVTATHLALALTDIYPVRRGTDVNAYGTVGDYLSCGPYRVESATGTQILLTPNPHWTGAEVAYEQVLCREAS